MRRLVFLFFVIFLGLDLSAQIIPVDPEDTLGEATYIQNYNPAASKIFKRVLSPLKQTTEKSEDQ